MVGTLGVGHPPAPGANGGGDDWTRGLLASGLTTPDPVLLQRSLRHFAQAGLRACALEASSIGIEEHRLDGTRIKTAIFTNFTQDHLDYHGDMLAYWSAKARLFAWPGLRSAVINLDDPNAAQLLGALRHGPVDVWSVSCHAPARLRASDITHTARGLSFNLAEADEVHRLDTGLIGHFNVSNLLGVIAAMRSLEVALVDAVAACADLGAVPGRMQCLGAPGTPLVVIDYAHTPDALEKALAALRPLALQRSGRLWCVFGCGGDRDPGKRVLMGAVAAKGADHVLLTSDNPRSENPCDILRQIMPGLDGHGSVTLEADRGAAIAQALQRAGATDVVLVAGKGHEAYQETAGVRRPFSDLLQVRQGLANWRPGATARGVGP